MTYYFKASPMPDFKKLHMKEEERRARGKEAEPELTIPLKFNLETEKRSRGGSHNKHTSPSATSCSLAVGGSGYKSSLGHTKKIVRSREPL